MRPLFHPSISDITVEGIMHALSDPVRVTLYTRIAGAECPQSCSAFLTISERAVPKATLSQHLKVLREAGLVRGERLGKEMRNTSRCAEIEDRFPGLLKGIVGAYLIQGAGKTKTPKRKGASK